MRRELIDPLRLKVLDVAGPRSVSARMSQGVDMTAGANAEAQERRLMKKDIHPAYHEIKVLMTNGETVTMRSTYGAPGASLALDIDPLSHPAWTGGPAKILDGGRVSKFNQKFGAFGLKK